MTTKKMKYGVTTHAVERIRQYFDVKEYDAQAELNDMMRRAKYVHTQPDGRLVYKDDVKDVMIVVSETDKKIITLLPPKGKGDDNGGVVRAIHDKTNEFSKGLQTVLNRELRKAERLFTREFRKITEEIAVIGVEVAKLNWNKARARSPITQQQIADKVGELNREIERMADERKMLKKKYDEMSDGLKRLISE